MIVSKLNALLKRKGWTLYHLRKISGVSYPTLLALRDSRTGMFRADVMEKLCEAFKCQPGDILKYDPDVERPRAKLRKRK